MVGGSSTGDEATPSAVVFTMHDGPGMVGRFLRRGTAGYSPKSAEMGGLIEAVGDAARAMAPGSPDGAGAFGERQGAKGGG